MSSALADSASKFRSIGENGASSSAHTDCSASVNTDLAFGGVLPVAVSRFQHSNGLKGEELVAWISSFWTLSVLRACIWTGGGAALRDSAAVTTVGEMFAAFRATTTISTLLVGESITHWSIVPIAVAVHDKCRLSEGLNGEEGTMVDL